MAPRRPKKPSRSQQTSIRAKHTSLQPIKTTNPPLLEREFPGGTVHERLPENLRLELSSSPNALRAWFDITPLARNEFICWVLDAKLEATREKRTRRAREELEEGKRRPCCWPGCKHRK